MREVVLLSYPVTYYQPEPWIHFNGTIMSQYTSFQKKLQ